MGTTQGIKVWPLALLAAIISNTAFARGAKAQLCGEMQALSTPTWGGSALGTSADGSVTVGWSSDSGWVQYRPLMWNSEGSALDLTLTIGESMAMGVSDDGRVIVGWRNSGGSWTPYRWSQSEGLLDLGVSHAVAWRASYDGSRVACYGIIGGAQRAYLWTEGVGLADLGTLPGCPEAVATGISSDGSTVVGFSKEVVPGTSTVSRYRAFSWSDVEGMRDLGTLGGADAYAYDASADGRVIVGVSIDGAGVPRAFRWEDGTMTEIGPANSTAYGVSADGRVVVGVMHSPTARAFRWTLSSGAQDLGSLGGNTASAWDVSADGRVVVGRSTDVGNGEGPFRWSAEPSLADYDRDFYLQVTDFLDFLDDFGSCQGMPIPCGHYGNPDINGDGTIDVLDFLDYMDAFGQGC